MSEEEKYEQKIIFFTGAGISAPSGIPTFRDKGGIWEKNDVNIVCNYRNWKGHREEVFEFFSEIREKYSEAEPNEAHKFIAKIQKKFGTERVKVVTQNIDLLFEKAGCEDVLHLHGKICNLQCTACATIWESEIDFYERCPKCNSWRGVKPNVIMFNEEPPNYYIFKQIMRNLNSNDIFVIVGTNGIVVNPTEFLPRKKKRKHKKYYDYWETNYVLNVMDENHYLQIPSDPDLYGIESCITFLPKIEDFICEKMES